MTGFNELRGFVKKLAPAVVSFSGGVDSALVAKAVFEADSRSVAVLSRDETVSQREFENAVKVAREIGIKLIVVSARKPNAFFRNEGDRCFYCKKTVYSLAKQVACKRGLKTVLDGSNAGDVKDHVFGLKAAREEKVVSPLLELGWNKRNVRECAKKIGLSVWGKPETACLSSRLPCGELISKEKLGLVECGEEVVRRVFGVKQVRVRLRADCACIEVGGNERKKFFDLKKLSLLARELKKKGFKRVLLDVEGYKGGGA